MSDIFTYGKKEKLKRRKLIAELFASKQSFLVFPVKVFYMQPVQATDFFIKAGVSASSRNFKKATDRNRVKRLLREAYRVNKLPLHQYLEEHDKQAIVFFLYIDKVLPQKNVLQSKMPLIIQQLVKRLDEAVPQNT